MNQYIEVHIGNESNDELDCATTSFRRKKRNRNWCMFATYNSKEEAVDAVSEDSKWSYHYESTTSEGKKHYYRCNAMKRRGPQCDASLYILYKWSNTNAIIYKTEEGHSHEEEGHSHEEEVNRGKLSLTVKEKIKSYFESNMKPKKMMEMLSSQGFSIEKSQLSNYLTKLRNNTCNPTKISLGELEQWCLNHSEIPNEDNTPYVVCHNVKYPDVEYEDEQNKREFGIFISTNRLLKHAKIRNNIHIDATYKLVWEGMPVIIIGTTDFDRHFHPTGMAVCSGESQSDFEFIFQSVLIGLKNNKEEIQVDYLISDASNAIRNAFKNVFGANKIQIMCWAHVRRNVVKKIQSLVKEVYKSEILEDIDALQLSPNKEVFEKAKSLFVSKWTQKQETQFIDYMLSQWLTSHQNWYEGAAILTPSTNNALKSFNLCIKKEEILRERLPLSRYLEVSFNSLEKWSKGYVLGLKTFNIETTIHLNEWTKGYQLAKSNLYIYPHGNIYLCPAKGKNVSKEELLKMKELKWDTFDQFKNIGFSGWIVEIPEDNWSSGRCTCPNYLKIYICKHIIGIAIVLKYVKPPPAAKTIPIGMMRKKTKTKVSY